MGVLVVSARNEQRSYPSARDLAERSHACRIGQTDEFRPRQPLDPVYHQLCRIVDRHRAEDGGAQVEPVEPAVGWLDSKLNSTAGRCQAPTERPAR